MVKVPRNYHVVKSPGGGGGEGGYRLAHGLIGWGLEFDGGRGRGERWVYESEAYEFVKKESETRMTASVLPSTGQENNIAQPKTNKWFSFSSQFSSFITV